MLSPDERNHLAKAVADAEAVCGAEVVVVGYARADGYKDVALQNAVVASLLSLAAVLFLPVDIEHVLVFPIVAACTLLAFFASRLEPVLRLTSTAARRAQAVEACVARSFLARGVHKTRARVGLLVVWFELEDAVRVVFDSGLEARVPEDVRARVVADLDAVKDPARRAAAIAAIGAAVAAFVPKGDDDENELDDAVGAHAIGGAA